jgi:small subunit ribosomal protein S14
MAKKSMIARENRRKKLCEKYSEKRASLIAAIADPDTSEKDRVSLQKKLNKLPRDAYKTRQNSRCSQCGRPRAVSKRFGLCRICTRLFFVKAYLPGVRKSSW